MTPDMKLLSYMNISEDNTIKITDVLLKYKTLATLSTTSLSLIGTIVLLQFIIMAGYSHKIIHLLVVLCAILLVVIAAVQLVIGIQIALTEIQVGSNWSEKLYLAYTVMGMTPLIGSACGLALIFLLYPLWKRV